MNCQLVQIIEQQAGGNVLCTGVMRERDVKRQTRGGYVLKSAVETGGFWLFLQLLLAPYKLKLCAWAF